MSSRTLLTFAALVSTNAETMEYYGVAETIANWRDGSVAVSPAHVLEARHKRRQFWDQCQRDKGEEFFSASYTLASELEELVSMNESLINSENALIQARREGRLCEIDWAAFCVRYLRRDCELTEDGQDVRATVATTATPDVVPAPIRPLA